MSIPIDWSTLTSSERGAQGAGESCPVLPSGPIRSQRPALHAEGKRKLALSVASLVVGLIGRCSPFLTITFAPPAK